VESGLAGRLSRASPSSRIIRSVSLTRGLRAVVPVGVLLAVLAVPGAPAAQSRSLALTVAITGKGTVRLSTGRQVACAASCKRTVLVRAGSRLTLTTQPGTGWKLGTWAGACRGTSSTCKVRMTRAARVGVTFIAPGTQRNPIPLGQAATVRKIWSMKVMSVTPNANTQVLAANNNAQYAQVPPGAQDFMVSLSVTYNGGGSADIGIGLIGLVETVGSHGAIYDTNTTPCPGSWPEPSFKYVEQRLFSGQSATGNICYLIAANDADSLVMFVYNDANDTQKLWYALRWQTSRRS
jgi:hypothetical protein